MVRVLLLDDSPDLLQMVVDTLDFGGHEVTVGINGKDGLKKLAEMTELPDIIFTDIRMPEMNGWEFIVNVKHKPEWMFIPCVVFSGDEFDHEIATERGADAALIKPLHPKHVAQIIERLVKPRPVKAIPAFSGFDSISPLPELEPVPVEQPTQPGFSTSLKSITGEADTKVPDEKPDTKNRLA
jgi:CheY-like chemotaxis protein